MNSVVIVGKIQRINVAESGKMCFITVKENRVQGETNFIDTVCFTPEFISKNFPVGKWIGITGHLHTSKYNNEYKTDVIIDNINFIGDKDTTSNNEFNNCESSFEGFTAEEFNEDDLPY